MEAAAEGAEARIARLAHRAEDSGEGAILAEYQPCMAESHLGWLSGENRCKERKLYV